MEPWETREWHADFLDACNRHDLDAIGAFLEPDVRRAHLPSGKDAWLTDVAEFAMYRVTNRRITEFSGTSATHAELIRQLA